ncbi:hypothetical protein MASR2M48_29040 [Spirochaetota bacterium]
MLPYVENGTIILIGATTENPFFEVNKALVSRSRVFQLHPLGEDDLLAAATAALNDKERGYGRWQVSFEDGALAHLIKVSDGDARSLLNALELAVETSVDPWPPKAGNKVVVTMGAAEESIQRRAVLYDREGDYHYDAASAFIKSIRGSEPGRGTLLAGQDGLCGRRAPFYLQAHVNLGFRGCGSRRSWCHRRRRVLCGSL